MMDVCWLLVMDGYRWLMMDGYWYFPIMICGWLMVGFAMSIGGQYWRLTTDDGQPRLYTMVNCWLKVVDDGSLAGAG